MKKRMVSLIVALCMMISLFPVSVFADDGVALYATQLNLVINSSGYPRDSIDGNGWSYQNKTLTLESSSYDFSNPLTNPSQASLASDLKIIVKGSATVENTVFHGEVYSDGGVIQNCIFDSDATLSCCFGRIENSLFAVRPASAGLSLYTMEASGAAVTLKNALSSISGSSVYYVGVPTIVFSGAVPSLVKFIDSDGYYWVQSPVASEITPNEPNPELVINSSGPNEGRPCTDGAKTNGTTYLGNGWTYDGTTLTLAPLSPKTYDFSNDSAIGCFVDLHENAILTGGTFAVTVTAQNPDSIKGGIFNGNSSLPSTAYAVILDGSSILSVNGTQATWTPYVVVTSDSAEQTVTLTADVDITTLNYEDVGSVYDSSYPEGDHKTVTFTMPAEDVTLNLVKPTVTVRNNIDSTEQAPVAAKPGEEVQITAESKRGYTFLNWESDDITLSDKTQNPLTIASMPDHDITLTANYEYSKLVISDKGVPTLPSGKDWWYDEDNNTLHLEPTTRTEYDFSREPLNPGGYDIKCKIVGNENTILVGGKFDNTVENNGEITDGMFNDSVKNNGTISGGTYNDSVENNGTIKDGTFNGPVENAENGVIEGGNFNNTVKNDGLIKDGTFNGEVDNSEKGTIDGGAFKDTVKNDGTINDGTFNDKVDNTETGTINGGTFKDTVDNDGKITDGTFDGGVNNGENGDISGGTFNGDVDNKGDVTGGDFNGNVENHPGSTFEPDSDVNKTYTVTIEGGTINGKTTVKAKKGTELTAVLDTNDIPDGMAFDMWSLSSNALTGDPSVDLKASSMTFRMPAEDVTIRAQYISSAIAEDSPGLSPLGTAVLITAGTAVTGVALWQGYKIGVELYMERELPLGTPIPTNRRELALLLWNTVGKPEPASAELFSDIDAQDLDLQKASHWAQEHQLLGVANEYNLTLFEPESAVNETDVLLGWLRTKKLLRNVVTS